MTSYRIACWMLATALLGALSAELRAQTGACCLPDGSCRDVTETDCAGLGGVFSPNMLCSPFGCPGGSEVGACRIEAGGMVTCIETTAADCLAQGGAFDGPGTSCDSGETGACCLADGSCIEIDASACLNEGGRFQGPGTVCSDPEIDCDPPDPNAPVAACCFADGSCATLDEPTCLARGGRFLANAQCTPLGGCPGDPNGDTGACRIESGGTVSCIETTRDDCLAQGGVFFGVGTTCDDQLGACCLPNACLNTSAADCAASGGTFQGPDTTCTPLGGCPGSGDLNGDGHVDISDLSIELADFGCRGPACAGDSDGDGDSDIADLALVLKHYGL